MILPTGSNVSSAGCIGLLCCGSGLCGLSCLCCCGCLSLGFCLGLCLCLGGCLFGFALADGLSPLLIYLSLGVEELAAGLIVSLLEILLLGLDLGVSLGFPCVPSLVGYFLGDSALCNTAVEMLPQENTLVGEDAAAGVRRLSACAEPVEGSLGVDLDGCGIGVGIVGSDLLDVTSVTG